MNPKIVKIKYQTWNKNAISEYCTIFYNKKGRDTSQNPMYSDLEPYKRKSVNMLVSHTRPPSLPV